MPHVFITGAAGGLGRHLVGVWTRRGWRITATDLDATWLGVIARQDGWGREVRTAALDVVDAAAWERVWSESEAELGQVDIVVNNAGFLAPDWVIATTVADVDRHVDVNVKGVIHGSRVAARHMSARRGGHIVNIGSLASLAPVPGLSLYAASKFAVRGFTLSLAAEMQEHGVAVSLVMPDAIATPMLDVQKSRAEAELTFSGSRVLTPADVAVALDEVFARKPVELSVPPERGALAKVAALAPGLGFRLAPWLRRLGRKGQERYRG
jgi:short-subunit dehydrogenase